MSVDLPQSIHFGMFDTLCYVLRKNYGARGLTFDMYVIFPPTVSVWSHYQEQSLIPSYALNLIYTTIFLISIHHGRQSLRAKNNKDG